MEANKIIKKVLSSGKFWLAITVIVYSIFQYYHTPATFIRYIFAATIIAFVVRYITEKLREIDTKEIFTSRKWSLLCLFLGTGVGIFIFFSSSAWASSNLSVSTRLIGEYFSFFMVLFAYVIVFIADFNYQKGLPDIEEEACP